MAKSTAKPKKEKEPVTHLSPPEQTVDPHRFNGLRSMYAIIENFKNISARVVDIGGRSMMIIGRNQAGKSSLIHALKGSLLSKYRPAEGLMKGQEHGYISHKIAGNINTPSGPQYHEYTIDIYFDEKTKEGRLKLTNENGEDVKSPAEKLKYLIGNVSFDVNAWLGKPPREKLQMLKDLTGRGKEIDLLSIDIKDKEGKRKAKIDRADELEAIIKNHGMSEEEIQRYSNPIDVTPIQQEMETVAQAQAQFDGVRAQADGFYKSIQDAQSKITANVQEKARIAAEIARLQEIMNNLDADSVVQSDAIVRAEKNAMEAEAWMRQWPRKEIGDISERMTQANLHNQKHQQLNTLTLQFSEKVKLMQEAENMKIEIQQMKDKRNEVIANSQLPVPGLSFTDEAILLNDLPFDDLQINTATRWKVGIQIAKALNPNYKGIFIEDGSLFDKVNLKEIVEEIEKGDEYFAIIELVSYSGGELEVKFTETELFGQEA